MRPATMQTNAFVDAIEAKQRASNQELRKMIDGELIDVLID